MLIEKLGIFIPLGVGVIDKKMIPKIRQLRNPQPMVSDSFIGIEVEVEGIEIRMPLLYWECKEDGSLRNMGAEFVTRPIKATEAPQALYELHKQLMKVNPEFDFSLRTSVHVHINARDMTLAEVSAMSVIYLLFERAFFKFAGRNRDKSIFCVPYQDSQEYSNMVDHLQYVKKNNATSVAIFNKFRKYIAYNMKPISNFGTVEFRHMAGTIDEEKLLIWINLILSLKSYAMKHTLADILSIAYELTTTSKYSVVANEVFGEYAKYVMYDIAEVDMYNCILGIKEAFTANDSIPLIKLNVLTKSAFGERQLTRLPPVEEEQAKYQERLLRHIQLLQADADIGRG